MKHLLLIPAILICSLCKAQVKSKLPVVDTLAKYHLTEQQIVSISNLLNYADGVAGNSDKISTRDWRTFHAAIVSVDSILRVQYSKFHPVKAEPKKQ